MAYALLGSQPLQFSFPPDKTSTRDSKIHIDPPQGTTQITITLQGYNFEYSDGRQYGFGQLGATLSTVLEGTTWFAVCAATLRDDKHDERKWDATVTGLLQYWGNLD